MFGVCNLSIVPIRKNGDNKSEMISQLLYGDLYDVIEKKEKWLLIKTVFDNYQGWIEKNQFIEFEKNYWKNSTAIGFIFSLGALMGFVVGCVVVYQILYSDVTDHLPEYATLLAMGYRIKSLFFVVAREGFLLALFGYLPAYFSGQILYSVIRSSTKLPIIMDAHKTILIFVLVLVMCMGSAAVAMRKLVDADPAEIF